MRPAFFCLLLIGQLFKSQTAQSLSFIGGGSAVRGVLRKSTTTTTTTPFSSIIIVLSSCCGEHNKDGGVGGVGGAPPTGLTAWGCATKAVDDRRRDVLRSCGLLSIGSFFVEPRRACSTEEFVRSTEDFSYVFAPPPGFETSNKPLKTHLDEVNFLSPNTKGYYYQYGITVDPVKISALREFGTPEEVAARVVTAEVNRDGVAEVTLMTDPVDQNGSYILNFLSRGKRGNKRNVCKIIARNGMLFVLTMQIMEDAFEASQDEINKAVDSFRVP